MWNLEIQLALLNMRKLYKTNPIVRPHVLHFKIQNPKLWLCFRKMCCLWESAPSWSEWVFTTNSANCWWTEWRPWTAPTTSCSSARVNCLCWTFTLRFYSNVCVFFTMDKIFLYTSADSGLVLKAIHLPREHGQGQEVTLEQMQVFQVQPPLNKTQCYLHTIVYVPTHLL